MEKYFCTLTYAAKDTPNAKDFIKRLRRYENNDVDSDDDELPWWQK